jgi:HlyD family secretion protein
MSFDPNDGNEFDILRNNKNFLMAPVSGRLTSFEPILGKTFQAGESIGRIDSREGYKLTQVDEFYLRKSVRV